MTTSYPVIDHIHTPEKVIKLADGKLVDVTEFIPIVDHPIFQHLSGKKQLGLVEKIFRGATHTRFYHSAAALYYAREILRYLQIQGDLAKAISAYALLHDIGHPPFSHQTEPLLSQTHDDYGLTLLDELKDVIEQTGTDFEFVRILFQGKNPYYSTVYDKNLGADKLSYLHYDSYFMGLTLAIDIPTIIRYTVFVDGKIAQDEKNIDEMMESQLHYAKLHIKGYLRKQSLINQRILQRAVQESMQVDGYGEEEIWRMADADLEARLMSSASPIAKDLYRRIRDRDTMLTAVVLRVDRYTNHESIAEKPICVRGLPHEVIRKFMKKFETPQSVTTFEDQLSEEFKLPKGQLLLTPMPYFVRLIPKDVWIYSRQLGTLYSLFDERPDHHQLLESKYAGSLAIRFATTREFRERVCKLGPQLKQRVLEVSKA